MFEYTRPKTNARFAFRHVMATLTRKRGGRLQLRQIHNDKLVLAASFPEYVANPRLTPGIIDLLNIIFIGLKYRIYVDYRKLFSVFDSEERGENF
jgi:hypothetical protein